MSAPQAADHLRRAITALETAHDEIRKAGACYPDPEALAVFTSTRNNVALCRGYAMALEVIARAWVEGEAA